MKNTRQQFLKFIKIYSMDNSWQSNKTLYRVIKESFGRIDRATMQKALQSFPGIRVGEILEYANNIGDVDFIEKFYKYRNISIKSKEKQYQNCKIEKYNGYSNKDLVVEQSDSDDLSFVK